MTLLSRMTVLYYSKSQIYLAVISLSMFDPKIILHFTLLVFFFLIHKMPQAIVHFTLPYSVLNEVTG